MTNMIERVAQAIFAKDPESLFTIHQARVYARAAIAAMREPTDSMYMAGGIVALSVRLADKDYKPYGTRIIGDMAPRAEWQAMIDAALEDK